MQKKNIPLLCVITFLQGMVFYASVATLYREAAGLSMLEIGTIEAVNLALSMALEVPWGWLADRIGYRKTMIACNALFLVTKIIFWRAEGFAGFLAERVLLAVVLSGLSGVDSSMLYLSAPPEENQRNEGWCQAVGEAGLLLSALLYTAFLSGQYRAAALWTMIAYGLAAVLTFFLAEVKPEEECQQKGSMLALVKEHFRVPGMIQLVLCCTLAGETMQCMMVFFNQKLYVRCGMSDRMIHAAFLVMTLAGLCGPLSHRITKRLGRKRMGLGILVTAALCAGVLAVTGSGLLSVVLITMISAAGALFSPLVGSMENEMIRTPDRATAMSLNAIVGGSLAVPMELGLNGMADVSIPGTMILCAVLCVAAAALYSRTIKCSAVQNS